MKKWQKKSKEEIERICKESNCISDFMKRLGYDGGFSRGKEIIDYYNLDTSHFHGQNWNKNNFDLTPFRKGTAIKSERRIAVLKHLRGERCEECGLSEWMDQPIPLCTHHIDGDHLNNDLTNLRLLCPNCHALTENYCGKNKGKQQKYTEEMYIQALRDSSNIRQALLSMGINYSSRVHYEKCYELIDKYNLDHLK